MVTFRNLSALFRYRGLIQTLVVRDRKARYRGSVLGFFWSFINPLLLLLIYTFVFKYVMPAAPQGTDPYPLFMFCGLLPWTFFSTSVAQGGQSLVLNNQLLNKVYCPREVFPMASTVVAAIDTTIAVAVLGLLFVVTGFVPKATSVWVPVLLGVQVAFTFGATLVISAVLVFFRDLRHALPVILQLGLFATPVAYGMDVVPENLQVLYSAVNPLAPVIDGYRRTILLGLPPDWQLLVPGAVVSAVLLVAGYAVFKRMEPGFADYA